MSYCSIKKVNKMAYSVYVSLDDDLRGIIIEAAVKRAAPSRYGPTRSDVTEYDIGVEGGHVTFGRQRVGFDQSEVRRFAFDYAIECLNRDFLGADEFIPFIKESTLIEQHGGYLLEGAIELPVPRHNRG